MEQNTLLTISSIGAMIAAIAAVAAAFGAWRSASETRKTSLAQIIVQITSAYSSEEMGESIKRLYAHKHHYEEDFAGVFGQLLTSSEEPLRTYANQLDADRRRISHYFHRIEILLDCGVVDENFVKTLVKSNQVDTLLDIIEPLERAKGEDYDRSTFDLFRRIYDKKGIIGEHENVLTSQKSSKLSLWWRRYDSILFFAAAGINVSLLVYGLLSFTELKPIVKVAYSSQNIAATLALFVALLEARSKKSKIILTTTIELFILGLFAQFLSLLS